LTGEAGIKKTKKLPVGISDFRDIVTGNYIYVDKTLFIKEIIDRGDKILLIPRPRRFGKTLNLSMLKYFFDSIPDPVYKSPGSTSPEKPEGTQGSSKKHLFDSLAIMKAGKEYLDKMGRYPVIFLSFRGLKEMDWDSCLREIKQLIQAEYLKHDYLLQESKLKIQEQDYFKRIVDLSGDKVDYKNSLAKLMVFLNRYHGKRAIILIDEYDAPVHAGFTHGYYDEIINFMRNFLCSALKDTDQFLEKSVLTGIMRIAKESIFSGLNNPGVYTFLSNAFNDKFGFTESEVENLLREFQVYDKYDGVREWYNGYRFGENVIYNPWSIINFLADDQKSFKPYWLNTSDNAIVETLLSRGGKELKEELEMLIRGETIEKAVDENIVLKNVETDDNSLWSFLLMGGYLKTISERRAPVTVEMYYKMAIPNLEVKAAYIQIIKRYFSTRIENRTLEIMLKALLEGDINVFEEIFADYVVKAMSFFDTAVEPEKVYHAFVMGLFLWLSPDYEVKSNRESGYGRYDIMIIPKETGKLGFIIEFKKTRKKETLETAVKSALEQIENLKYESELLHRGIKNYKKLAIVFKGKEVVIKEG